MLECLPMSHACDLCGFKTTANGGRYAAEKCLEEYNDHECRAYYGA